MPPIRFRCVRCQHAVKAPKDAAGRKMFCPVCYLELTVPAESTVKPVDPLQLYTADEKPVDVRDMKDRRRFLSLRCSVCHTNIAVSREQVGTEIVCPECETKIVVPESIAQKFDASLTDQLDRIMQGIGATSGRETYEVRDGGDGAPREDWTKRYPVYCKLCGTMMYASEDQVGRELTCPDCETKTVVPPRPVKLPALEAAPLAFEGGTTFGVAGEHPDGVPPGEGRLVPVVCSLCATRMYARESEIGGFKVCPDCGRETEIKAIPENQMLAPDTFSADGYSVDEAAESGPRPVFRTLTDYRFVEGSLDKEHYDARDVEAIRRGEFSPASPSWHSDGRDIDAEALAERRKEKMLLADSDAPPEWVERKPLPKYPFLSRLLTPFRDPWLVFRLALAVLLGVLGYFVGTFLPGLFFVVGVPLGLMILLIAACVFTNTCRSVFLWTTAGNDLPETADWVDSTPFDNIVFTLWLFFVVILAAAPGYYLASLFPIPNEQDAVWVPIRDFLCNSLSFGLFFPILFLSGMESDSFFMLLAPSTLRSLLEQTAVWIRFWFASLVLGAALVLTTALLSPLASLESIGLALEGFLLMFYATVYFRILGRLAWVLEESARQAAEEDSAGSPG